MLKVNVSLNLQINVYRVGLDDEWTDTTIDPPAKGQLSKFSQTI